MHPLVFFFCEMCCRICNEMPRKRNILVTKRWVQLDQKKMGTHIRTRRPAQQKRSRSRSVARLRHLLLVLLLLLLLSSFGFGRLVHQVQQVLDSGLFVVFKFCLLLASPSTCFFQLAALVVSALTFPISSCMLGQPVSPVRSVKP